MHVCRVCGKVCDSVDDIDETCSDGCRDELERLQPAGTRPPHSSPRQVEERPSEPGLPFPTTIDIG